MNYRELIEELQLLTPEQMKQEVKFFDDSNGSFLEYWDIQEDEDGHVIIKLDS